MKARLAGKAELAGSHSGVPKTRTQRRLDKYRAEFDREREAAVRSMARAGAIDLRGLSFELWLLEEKAGWRESDFGPERFIEVWRWWLKLHAAHRVSLIMSHRDFRRRMGGMKWFNRAA